MHNDKKMSKSDKKTSIIAMFLCINPSPSKFEENQSRHFRKITPDGLMDTCRDSQMDYAYFKIRCKPMGDENVIAWWQILKFDIDRKKYHAK